jgi:cobalt/nickel transport system permease protein
MSVLEAVKKIDAVEELAFAQTPVHRQSPLAKLITTVLFIGTVVSFGPYAVWPLLPYIAYPVWMMLLAELPFSLMLSRLAAALPFVAFIGIANVLLMPQTAFVLGGVAVSYGVLSLFSLLLKTLLCVFAALILVATTRLHDLCAALLALKTPQVFVTVFLLTYRYISVIALQAHQMLASYRLRTGFRRLQLRHMGPLAGQLLIQSYARASRVYDAMLLRGYGSPAKAKPLNIYGVLYILLLTFAFLFLRIVDVTALFGRLF